MKTGHKILVITTSGKWIEINDNTLLVETPRGTGVLKSGDWSRLITEYKIIIPLERELLWEGSVEYLKNYEHTLIMESESEEFLVYKLGSKIRQKQSKPTITKVTWNGFPIAGLHLLL
jgi:hypothetical protein